MFHYSSHSSYLNQNLFTFECMRKLFPVECIHIFMESVILFYCEGEWLHVFTYLAHGVMSWLMECLKYFIICIAYLRISLPRVTYIAFFTCFIYAVWHLLEQFSVLSSRLQCPALKAQCHWLQCRACACNILPFLLFMTRGCLIFNLSEPGKEKSIL